MLPKITLPAFLLALSAIFSVFSAATEKPALAEPLVVKDKNGNLAVVEQSGGTTMRPKEPKEKQPYSGAGAGHPAGVSHPDLEHDDLGIVTDEVEGEVFEDEEGNIAVIEQDEEPAAQVLPVD